MEKINSLVPIVAIVIVFIAPIAIPALALLMHISVCTLISVITPGGGGYYCL